MTEAEWLDCTDPGKMLEFLRGRVSQRKLRLVAVACCGALDHLLFAPGRAVREPGVELAERYAEGQATEEERQQAWDAEEQRREWDKPPSCPQWAVEADAFEAARGSALTAFATLEEYEGPEDAERLFQVQCALLRDLFGNPFRPVVLDPAWLAWDGGAVVQLARSVYEERDPGSGELDRARLAVLADMLEEAGCNDAELLGHLRSARPHVRGCFAVDLLFGRG
jgi:hypothetical protein